MEYLMKKTCITLICVGLITGCATPDKSAFLNMDSSMSRLQKACLYDGLLEKEKTAAIRAVISDVENGGSVTTNTLNSHPDIGLVTRDCS